MTICNIPTATDELIYRASLGLPVDFSLRTEEDEGPVYIRKSCRECGRFFMADAEAYPCSCRECIGKALYRRDLAKRLKALGVEV